MNKIKAVWRDNKLFFKHFVVKRESENFVGVYRRCGSNCGPIVTSDETLKGAAKKAKLLEIGWNLGYGEGYDLYKEQCKYCSAWD